MQIDLACRPISAAAGNCRQLLTCALPACRALCKFEEVVQLMSMCSLGALSMQGPSQGLCWARLTCNGNNASRGLIDQPSARWFCNSAVVASASILQELTTRPACGTLPPGGRWRQGAASPLPSTLCTRWSAAGAPALAARPPLPCCWPQTRGLPSGACKPSLPVQALGASSTPDLHACGCTCACQPFEVQLALQLLPAADFCCSWLKGFCCLGKQVSIHGSAHVKPLPVAATQCGFRCLILLGRHPQLT